MLVATPASSKPIMQGRWQVTTNQAAIIALLREGAKVSFDIVANRGKESAENLRVSVRSISP
jgi:hypothetical protein